MPIYVYLNIKIDGLMFVLLNLTENATGIAQTIGERLQAFAGDWTILLGAVVLVVAAFFVLVVMKQVIANAICGIVALLVLIYIFNIPIPLTTLTILVTVLGGLGGVGALLLTMFLGGLGSA